MVVIGDNNINNLISGDNNNIGSEINIDDDNQINPSSSVTMISQNGNNIVSSISSSNTSNNNISKSLISQIESLAEEYYNLIRYKSELESKCRQISQTILKLLNQHNVDSINTCNYKVTRVLRKNLGYLKVNPDLQSLLDNYRIPYTTIKTTLVEYVSITSRSSNNKHGSDNNSNQQTLLL